MWYTIIITHFIKVTYHIYIHLKLLYTKVRKHTGIKNNTDKNTWENLNCIYFNMKRFIRNALVEMGSAAMELEDKNNNDLRYINDTD